MTEQKNSSEKTEKTDRNEKPASAPKKPSIEPKSARGASTTARRKTAKEADAALQDKIEKARAGAMPERGEPAAAGESAGLPPVQTVRAMPQINRKKDETMSDEKAAAPAKKTDKSQKAAAKKPSAPIKMPERDATGRFLPSEEKAKKPRAKAKAQQARTEDVKKPSEMPEAKPAQKTQEAKAAKKPEGPVTSAAPATPVTHVKPVLSLLMDEAPSGVMTDMKANDRPAPGEVRGKPADETNEAASSPVLKPSVSQSPNGSRIIDIDGEEDEEEDYDDIPAPAVSVCESADDDEIDDDEPDDDDDQSSADRPVKKPVSIIRPAAEDPEPVELDSQGRPYHATEVLSGRRTPVRVKPPVEEPADPSRTVDLEAERIDAEHTARQALLRLHARTEPSPRVPNWLRCWSPGRLSRWSAAILRSRRIPLRKVIRIPFPTGTRTPAARVGTRSGETAFAMPRLSRTRWSTCVVRRAMRLTRTNVLRSSVTKPMPAAWMPGKRT